MIQTNVWVTGLNHDTAPVEVREQFALSGESLDAALRAARPAASPGNRGWGLGDRVRMQTPTPNSQPPTPSEVIILSTCNRTEVYTLLQNGRPDRLLHGIFGEPASDASPYVYSLGGDAAVRHLFRVASGIDSLVLGEVQILGQVQRAWQAAHRAGAAGPVLSQLFHRAVALGKRVHNETRISRRPASVSYAAVVLARQVFGPQLNEHRALVIGTGEVGEGVARCLHEHGVRATVVAHRQVERAQALARRYHGDTASWDDLPRCLASADIVISSTAAPHYILQRRHIEEAMRLRAERPLYLIDLAVPRDIDPAAAELRGVHLHNVDDLQEVVRSTLEERQSALPEIEGMVEGETARFVEWLRARSTAPTIQELQAQAGELTRRELQWAMAKLPDLTDRERRVIEAMAARLAGKLLHGPIQWLKAQASDTRIGGEEPDYGMSRLSPRELSELFYRTAAPDTGEEEV